MYIARLFNNLKDEEGSLRTEINPKNLSVKMSFIY